MNALDLVYRKLSHHNLRRREECATLVKWLDARPGERVLDIGCGDGFHTARMAARGARLVGIDVSETRLGEARRRNAGPGIEYHSMDAERLDFPDGSFDKAISLCVIEHFRDDDRVLAEVGRVLKPGGTLFLSADSLTNPEIRADERESHRRRYAVNTFYSEPVLREKLARAGFALRRHRYILTSPVTLALVRLSWKLDDLPPRYGFLADAGYALMNTVGRAIAALGERVAGRPDSGLTLLAEAQRIQPPPRTASPS